MIQASELRIGNWVNDGQKYVQVEGWMFIQETKRISPIPIGHDILNNAGLIKSKEFDMWYGFDHRLCVEQGRSGWLWCIDDTGNNEGSIQRPVDYVHELQNIVYWIFNKELNIKL